MGTACTEDKDCNNDAKSTRFCNRGSCIDKDKYEDTLDDNKTEDAERLKIKDQLLKEKMKYEYFDISDYLSEF